MNESSQEAEQPYVSGEGIDVDDFISQYSVESPLVIEALRKYPTLSYLLSAGMFGLKNPDEAKKWSGMFNHIVGTTRQVAFLANRLKNLTDEQKAQLLSHGYSLEPLEKVDPRLLTDYMLVSHSGRRTADENKSDPYASTVNHLQKAKAPIEIQELMREEDHAYLTSGTINIIDNILTYCDWTYGQKPTTLEERFVGLRASQRQPLAILNQLESIGKNFENAVKAVLGDAVFTEMRETVWEDELPIREAYAHSAGLSVHEVFST